MAMARSNTAFLTTLVIILFLSQTVVAQFENMFNNMFGQQQQQRGGHHQQQQGSEHGVRGWDLQNAGESVRGGERLFVVAHQVLILYSISRMLEWTCLLGLRFLCGVSERVPLSLPVSLAVTTHAKAIRRLITCRIIRGPPQSYSEDYKCFLPEAPVSITKKLHLKSQGGSPSSNTESFVCIRAGEGRSPEKECDRVRRMAGGI